MKKSGLYELFWDLRSRRSASIVSRPGILHICRCDRARCFGGHVAGRSNLGIWDKWELGAGRINLRRSYCVLYYVWKQSARFMLEYKESGRWVVLGM
jgi:hypothetical protein